MIEPNLATMLVYLLTDLDVPRDGASRRARRGGRAVVQRDHGRLRHLHLRHRRAPLVAPPRRRPPRASSPTGSRRSAPTLAEDVVRNGEGVHHVVRVTVTRARTYEEARGVAKAVANSPLLKAAVNGNDPNVGRLLCAVGKHAGALGLPLDPAKVRMKVGGRGGARGGGDAARSREGAPARRAHEGRRSSTRARRRPTASRSSRRWTSRRTAGASRSRSTSRMGPSSCAVLGADLSHEYVTENADYRS